MEFVIVTCDGQDRTVFIDQQDQGATGRRLSVPEGVHVFDLGEPADYEPSSQEIDVRDTTRTEPLPVTFFPLPLGDEPAARRRKRARKRSAARKPARGKAKSRKAKAKRTKSTAKRTATSRKKK